jgi:hypothetical protein
MHTPIVEASDDEQSETMDINNDIDDNVSIDDDRPTSEEEYIVQSNSRHSSHIKFRIDAGRIPFSHHLYSYAAVMASVLPCNDVCHDKAFVAIAESIEPLNHLGESGNNPLPFIPEPLSIKQLLCEPLLI